jgi:hypothetical protein
MVKKILTLVMVLGVLGGVLSGCAQPADDTATTGTTATTAGATGTDDVN